MSLRLGCVAYIPKAEQGYAEMLKTSVSCMSTVSTATKPRKLLVSFEGSRAVTSSCRHDLTMLVSVCNKTMASFRLAHNSTADTSWHSAIYSKMILSSSAQTSLW